MWVLWGKPPACPINRTLSYPEVLQEPSSERQTWKGFSRTRAQAYLPSQGNASPQGPLQGRGFWELQAQWAWGIMGTRTRKQVGEVGVKRSKHHPQAWARAELGPAEDRSEPSKVYSSANREATGAQSLKTQQGLWLSGPLWSSARSCLRPKCPLLPKPDCSRTAQGWPKLSHHTRKKQPGQSLYLFRLPTHPWEAIPVSR